MTTMRERRVRIVALCALVTSAVACAGAATRPRGRSASIATGTDDCPASMRRLVVTRVNEARRRAHLRSLVDDTGLARAAAARARAMAAEHRLSHDGWDAVVHGNATAGENIAYND